MKLYPIVEGHGEVEAFPVLLRRLLIEAQCYAVNIGTPIRRTQAQLRNEQDVRHAVWLAQQQPECAAIVVLFDGEDDCPKELGDQVRTWARRVSGRTPVDVVIAYREYETWFLSALESLRGRYGIPHDAVPPAQPESRRGAKECLSELMPPNLAYSPTLHQAAMSANFEMADAWRRNRSFRKLVSSIGHLVDSLGYPAQPWPPAAWTVKNS